MAKGMEKFREMDRNELEIHERELGEQIFRLRFQLTTGQSESVKKLREARRDLARVKTLVRQQDLGKEPLSPKGAEQARKSGGKQSAKAKSAKE